MPKADLLTPIRRVKNLHPQFLNLISHDIYEPARGMLREVYAEFPDPDGNFVEQFQTSGFDARTFELFLFAMFKDLGHHIAREPRLDFILSRDGQEACVEAVIASPPPNDASSPTLTIRRTAPQRSCKNRRWPSASAVLCLANYRRNIGPCRARWASRSYSP